MTSGAGRVFYARVLGIIALTKEPNMMRAKRVLWCVAAGTAIAVGAMVGAQDKPAEKGLDQLKKGEAVTTASGLKVTLVEESKNPGAQNGDVVWVHYTGKLQDGGKQFDSSAGGKPYKLTLGKGEVIQGWDEGLVGMKVGEKRQLVIPAALGYKEKGSPPAIPPNATLVFDVEMIGVARPGQ
jgi:FKBP-type peptidyl-prolyl cis-trans isomerase